MSSGSEMVEGACWASRICDSLNTSTHVNIQKLYPGDARPLLDELLLPDLTQERWSTSRLSHPLTKCRGRRKRRVRTDLGLEQDTPDRGDRAIGAASHALPEVHSRRISYREKKEKESTVLTGGTLLQP